MKKHLALIKMVFLDRIEYPAEVFYQLTLALMPLAIAVYLWLAVYRGSQIIGSFNLPSMITASRTYAVSIIIYYFRVNIKYVVVLVTIGLLLSALEIISQKSTKQ